MLSNGMLSVVMLSKKTSLILLAPLLFCFIAEANETPCIALEEILPGMKCHGLSYFSPDGPERLELEVIGIVESTSKESAYILARVDSPSVRRGGIMSGMSGSPVYFGDRLVGAIALAYPFSREPVCGITPIGAMKRLTELQQESWKFINSPQTGNNLFSKPVSGTWNQLAPIGLSIDTRGMPNPGMSGIFSDPAIHPDQTQIAQSDVATQSDQSTHSEPAPAAKSDTKNAPSSQNSALSSPKTVPSSIPSSRESAPDTQKIAPSQVTDPSQICPGSSIGVGLVSGDVSITVFGTVTDVVDNHFLAFGHPMFGLGRCRLPIHTSNVVSFIPSLYVSFKVANSGPPIGTLTYDAEAGVLGEIGPIPPVIPVNVTIEGFTPQPAQYHLMVADNEYLTSNLIAQSLFGLIRNFGGIIGDLSMQIDLVVEMENGLKHQQSCLNGAVENPFNDILSAIDVIRQIHQNPHETVAFRKIGIRCVMSQSTAMATMDSLSIPNRQYQPGETLQAHLVFHGDRIESFDRTIRLRLPDNLAPGRYLLKAMDAESYRQQSGATRLPAHHFPDFESWFQTLADIVADNQILIALTADGNDVQTRNAALPAAPPVLQKLMTMPGMKNRAIRSTRILASETVSLNMEVFGGQQIPVFVNIRPEKIP